MSVEMERDEQRAISRLLEDESLTADLEDAPARVLLQWAIGQLRAGQAETAVRSAVRGLARLVARRTSLAPTDARARLQEAGLPAPDEAALLPLWSEQTLADGEWASRLLEALAPPPPQPASPPSEEEGVARPRPGRPWWQRIPFFWRHLL